jgi:hypothetical protein
MKVIPGKRHVQWIYIEFKKIDKTANHAIPKHYFYGPRKLNIILTQLRSSASFLDYVLFRVIIVFDPSCRCGGALKI